MTTAATCLWFSLSSLKEVWTEDYVCLLAHRKAHSCVFVCPWWHVLKGDTVGAVPSVGSTKRGKPAAASLCRLNSGFEAALTPSRSPVLWSQWAQTRGWEDSPAFICSARWILVFSEFMNAACSSASSSAAAPLSPSPSCHSLALPPNTFFCWVQCLCALGWRLAYRCLCLHGICFPLPF